jgi:L-alanine-DL-glutamate epimerase-like enolase superfamily enzyme
MKLNRRNFLGAGAAGLLMTPYSARAAGRADELSARIDRALGLPLVRQELFKRPVKIASMELLRNGELFLVRVRSTDGAEGVSVAHKQSMKFTYPIFVGMVAPFFVGRDAREVEHLVDGVYKKDINYKWHGLPFFTCIAAAEIAVLDLLGKVAGKPLGELFGRIVRAEIDMYPASGNRGNEARAEVAHLQKLVGESGARAFKFRLGGRMKYDEASTKRDRELVPLLRKTFGERTFIYGDGNSSYDVPQAIRTGRMLEEHKINIFEEPVPYDHYEETKQVADALRIPLAGGEQEMSTRQFRWMIERDAWQIVQPDLLYFGGFTRSIRVARMAEAAGKDCNPHMSGGGLGYVYVLHYASCVPNAGPFQELKGYDKDLPVACDTSTLRSKGGKISVPTGPGLGVEIDPGFIKRAAAVTL